MIYMNSLLASSRDLFQQRRLVAEIVGSLFAIHSEKQKSAGIGNIDCMLNAKRGVGVPNPGRGAIDICWIYGSDSVTIMATMCQSLDLWSPRTPLFMGLKGIFFTILICMWHSAYKEIFWFSSAKKVKQVGTQKLLSLLGICCPPDLAISQNSWNGFSERHLVTNT